MLRAFAPAKINLCLDVLGRRPDGFHDLATVFAALDYGDDLRAEVDPRLEADRLLVDGPFRVGVPTGPENLVLRAIAAARASFAPALPFLRITLTKRLPSQAGLGGGSSDAVAALRLAARAASVYPPVGELERIALTLGSDCPFFVRGGVQLGHGRGEALEPLSVARTIPVLVVVPRARVSTPEAFAALTDADKGPHSDLAALRAWLTRNDAAPMPADVSNAFQRGVAERHHAVRETLDRLERLGAQRVLLSGSGSACFAVAPAEGEYRGDAVLAVRCRAGRLEPPRP